MKERKEGRKERGGEGKGKQRKKRLEGLTRYAMDGPWQHAK